MSAAYSKLMTAFFFETLLWPRRLPIGRSLTFARLAHLLQCSPAVDALNTSVSIAHVKGQAWSGYDPNDIHSWRVRFGGTSGSASGRRQAVSRKSNYNKAEDDESLGDPMVCFFRRNESEMKSGAEAPQGTLTIQNLTSVAGRSWI
jgi:hypothetical protein